MVFSIGDDFWVTDEQGNEAFLVDGKVLRLRETFELRDRSGAIVATVRKRLLAVRDSMDIERDGAVIATVKKAVFSPLHHRSVVELPGGGELFEASEVRRLFSNGSPVMRVLVLGLMQETRPWRTPRRSPGPSLTDVPGTSNSRACG
jgi:LURP-one-related